MRVVRRLLFILFVVASMLSVSACDGEVEMDLYTSDLIDAVGSREPILSKISLIIEGMDEDYDYGFLERSIPSFSNPHYVEYEYSTSLAFDIKVPIVNSKYLDTFDEDGYLFTIVGEKDDGTYYYYIKINKDLIDRLNVYTNSTMYQSFRLEDFDFYYRLSNDLRNTCKCGVFSSYINGKAYPSTHYFNLERRDSLKIKFSEVMSKSFADEENYVFLMIN